MPTALVIDDSRATADSLCQMLALLGVNAQPAYGPRAALLWIGEIAPSIIFLDLNMPGVDGYEVLAYLKRQPKLAGIPVVVVTSDDQPETARKAVEAGALDVMVKPVSIMSIEATLQKLNLIT